MIAFDPKRMKVPYLTLAQTGPNIPWEDQQREAALQFLTQELKLRPKAPSTQVVVTRATLRTAHECE